CGSQWQVDGGVPQPSGATVLGLAVGKHTVSFSPTSGWTKPSNGSVTITNGAITSTTGVYTLNGLTGVDTNKPILSIVSPPKAALAVSNAAFTVEGTARDNVAVASVFVQLDGGAWTLASSSNPSFTNWTANVTLIPGKNTIRAYAVDTSGNCSPT